MRCPACLVDTAPHSMGALATHLVAQGHASDPGHVRWLNQNVSRVRLGPLEVETRLGELFDRGAGSIGSWIRRRFIAKFFGPAPHPFVLAMQHPSTAVLLGYVYEHQHFLRQWVRSCGFLLARTDEPDVVRYELDNLTTEFAGTGPEHPSHYELLLRMGESLGANREAVLATPPLESTAVGIREWDRICRELPWVEGVAAMHGLELIAHRDLVREGATVHYFDPAILASAEIPPAAVAFLREGYEADVGHSEAALVLVDRNATTEATRRNVQATFLRSIDLFDDYLIARLERGDRLAG